MRDEELMKGLVKGAYTEKVLGERRGGCCTEDRWVGEGLDESSVRGDTFRVIEGERHLLKKKGKGE